MRIRLRDPLIVPLDEAAYRLSLKKEAINLLIQDGELLEVNVYGQRLILVASLEAFARREARKARAARSEGTRSEERHV